MEQLDIEKVTSELRALKPIEVKFAGKVRHVHWLHRGTPEKFAEALKSKVNTKKERRNLQKRLLAIVLSDLWGSTRQTRGLRRWLWGLRLRFMQYSQPEAVAILDAAHMRLQQAKQLDLLMALTIEQMIAKLAACSNGEITN